MKIVRVFWLDTTTYSERRPIVLAKNAQLSPVMTIGLLLYEDKERVVIAPQQFDIPESEPRVCDFTAIPRGCITKIEKLK